MESRKVGTERVQKSSRERGDHLVAAIIQSIVLCVSPLITSIHVTKAKLLRLSSNSIDKGSFYGKFVVIFTRDSTEPERPLDVKSVFFCPQVGGYVINVMRDENRRKVAIYKEAFDLQCQQLVDSGAWERVFEHVNPNYYMKLHGLVQVYRKKEPLAKDEAFRRIMQV